MQPGSGSSPDHRIGVLEKGRSPGPSVVISKPPGHGGDMDTKVLGTWLVPFLGGVAIGIIIAWNVEVWSTGFGQVSK